MGIPTKLFISKPDDNLICPVCRDVFDDPKMLDCGHTFCAECLNSAHGIRCCPCCRKKGAMESYSSNLILKGLIGNLEISCKRNLMYQQSLRVCTWTGKLTDWAAHDANGKCLHKRVQCKLCKHKCHPQEMPQHMKEKSNEHKDEFIRDLTESFLCHSDDQLSELPDRIELCVNRSMEKLEKSFAASLTLEGALIRSHLATKSEEDNRDLRAALESELRTTFTRGARDIMNTLEAKLESEMEALTGEIRNKISLQLNLKLLVDIRTLWFHLESLPKEKQEAVTVYLLWISFFIAILAFFIAILAVGWSNRQILNETPPMST